MKNEDCYGDQKYFYSQPLARRRLEMNPEHPNQTVVEQLVDITVVLHVCAVITMNSF